MKLLELKNKNIYKIGGLSEQAQNVYLSLIEKHLKENSATLAGRFVASAEKIYVELVNIPIEVIAELDGAGLTVETA